MKFNLDRFRDRKIISVNDDCFGVTFTHWTRCRKSWAIKWADVLAIDAIQIEPAIIGFAFVVLNKRWYFAYEDMENWNALESAIKKRYANFNWDNFELAKNYVERQFPCWKS